MAEMMRFRVHGAVEETGEEVAVELLANSIGQARQKAFGMGLLVSRVEAIEDVHVTPPTTPFTTAVRDDPAGSPGRVTVIEQTAKVWKATQLIGVFVILVSFTVMAVMFATRTDGPSTVLGDLVKILSFLGFVIVGPIIYAIGRIGGWWHHG